MTKTWHEGQTPMLAKKQDYKKDEANVEQISICELIYEDV